MRRPSAVGCAAVARMVSSDVSVSNDTGEASSARRSARRRTCSALSSPDTYSVASPAVSRRAATCSNSVLFPMPGSPPTRTMLPGTSPPPSTKSNSLSCVIHRGVSAAVTCPSVTVLAAMPGRLRAAVRLLVGVLDTDSSPSVFHASQLSQRPAHLGNSAPHSVQR